VKHRWWENENISFGLLILLIGLSVGVCNMLSTTRLTP
jgi:hypothetical protein